jgi:phage shock protein C
MNKKLYRSETDKKFAGVAGGMADYFGFDSTWVRVAWAVFIIATGFFPGLLLYILMAFIVPTESEAKIVDVKFSESTTTDTKTENPTSDSTTA